MANPVAFPARPFQLRVVAWVIAQDVTNNLSHIGWQLWIDKLSYSPTSSGGTAGRWLKLNSTFVAETYTPGYDFSDGNNTANYLINVGSTWFSHNADGTLPMTITAQADFDILGTTPLLSTTLSIPTIPRASVASIAPPYTRDIGTLVAISTNRASSSFTHTIDWAFGATSGTLGTGITTSVNWTPPLSLISQIPNSTTGIATLTTKTYNGATLIGTRVSQFTLAVPTSVTPDFTTITSSEGTAGVAANVGGYVQGISKLNLGFSGVTTAYGSAIATYKLEALSGSTVLQTINASSGQTGIIPASGTITLRGTITDGRGRSKVKTTTVTFLAYAPPVINSVSVQRALNTGVVNESGTYLRVNINASVSSLVVSTQRNALNYRVSSQVRSTPPLVAKTTAAPGGITFNSYVTVGTYSITTAYDVLVEIFDDFLTTPTVIVVPVAAIFMHWNASLGMGIGKYRENGMLDVAGDVYSPGGLLLPAASAAEVLAGTISNKAVTPATLRAVSGAIAAVPTSVGSNATINADGSVTFTACSDLELNGIFTTAFRKYRIILSITSLSAVASIFLRGRLSGTTQTATNYMVTRHYGSNGSMFAVSQNGQTRIELAGGSGDRHDVDLLITDPRVSGPTAVVAQTSSIASGVAMPCNTAGFYNATAAFDGISIIPSSGTMIGHVSVYAYS